MVWPRVMPYPSIDFRVRVTGAFGAELPYRPFFTMLVVQEFDKSICWIAVGSLGICRGWTRGGYD